MTRGTKTAIPGITRVAKQQYRVRVVVTDTRTGKRRERQQQVTGTMDEAVAVKQRLRGEFVAACEAEHAAMRVHTVGRANAKETLSAFARRWLLHLKMTGRVRPHVLTTNLYALETHVLPFLGECDLAEIGGPEIGAWMERLGALRKEDGARYATETLATSWRVLRTMLRDAVVLAGLPRDATQGVRFRVKGAPPKVRTVLTVEEVSRVLAAAAPEASDVRLMLWVGFTTGMRFGEVSALLWSDVDVERRAILVRRSQVDGVVGPTKTGRARVVPLHPIVAGMLQEHRRWQIERQVRGLEAGIVFPSQKGTYRFASVLVKPLRRCCERASIGKVASPHDMRRTFNNLLRQAAGETVTRSIVGHATAAMTEHYSSVGLEERQAAQRAALGDALDGAAPKSGTSEWDLAEIGPKSHSEAESQNEEAPGIRGL